MTLATTVCLRVLNIMTTHNTMSLMPSDQWSLISDHNRDDSELPPYRRQSTSPAYEDCLNARRHITFDESVPHPARQPPPYGEQDSDLREGRRLRSIIRSSVRPYWEERRRSSARTDTTSGSNSSSRSPSPQQSASRSASRSRSSQNPNVGLYQGAPFVAASKSAWDDVLADNLWGLRLGKRSGSNRKVGSVRKLIAWDHPVYDMPADQQERLRRRGIDPVLAAELKASGMPVPI